VNSILGILVALSATLAWLEPTQAQEGTSRGEQSTEQSGSLRPLGNPYPDPQNVPGHEDGFGQTLRESFDLACKGEGTELGDLLFQIEVTETGLVDVSSKRPGPLSFSNVRAQVYMNAILWRVQGETYVVDRFKGRLGIEPGDRAWQCAKVGGRKF